MTNQDLCLKCGRCCYYMCDGKLKKCKHMVWITENRAYCRIYKNPRRVGMLLDKTKSGLTIRCNMRENVPFNYKDCPYNKPDYTDFDTEVLG